jgi:hypothetical protein
MKKLIIAILLGLSLISCSAGVGVNVGKHGVNGHAGISF